MRERGLLYAGVLLLTLACSRDATSRGTQGAAQAAARSDDTLASQSETSVAAPAGCPDSWLGYEPAVVELAGALRQVQKYGPPNYGESPATDQKVQVPILVLSSPVNVRADSASEVNTESFQCVREVQLVRLSSSPAYRRFVGQSIVATGTLFQRFTGHHHTDVLLVLRSIRQGPSQRQE